MTFVGLEFCWFVFLCFLIQTTYGYHEIICQLGKQIQSLSTQDHQRKEILMRFKAFGFYSYCDTTFHNTHNPTLHNIHNLDTPLQWNGPHNRIPVFKTRNICLTIKRIIIFCVCACVCFIFWSQALLKQNLIISEIQVEIRGNFQRHHGHDSFCDPKFLTTDNQQELFLD